MDVLQILKGLGLVISLVVLLIGAIHVFNRVQNLDHMDPSFKQVLKYLLLSCLVSDILCLLNLLLSAASGGWPLGFVTCEMWGFASTTMFALTAWLITTAVAERQYSGFQQAGLIFQDNFIYGSRYFAILLPSEVSSTFSHRNTRIISVGILLLLMMAASGPFYGFGEYTYLRGYIDVLVSTNISLPESLNQEGNSYAFKLENLHQLFSHLRRSSYISQRTDLLSVIASHIHQHYDITVSKAEWLPHGILFSIRALSSSTLDTFIEHYRDRILTKNITDLSFIEDVANTLNISDTELTAQISMTEYYNYRQNQLPVQDMGICSADLTTPNHHSSVWTGFYVSFSFILPYSASLAGLCAIYIRGFGYNSFASKRASDLDVSYTNIMSSIYMLTCVLNLIYFVTILSRDDGGFFSPSVVFWVSYIISLKTLPLVVTTSFGPNMCNCYCTCFNDCLKKMFKWKSANEIPYELNDLEMTQSLTGKRKPSNIVA